MRKKHGIKRNSRMYIILGFTLLYVFGMILTTYLVKNEKALLGGESASQINQFMMKEIEDVQLLYNEDGTLSDYSLDYMQYILSSNTQYMNQYTMISSGLLDAEGNLLAHTSDCVYPTIPMYVNGEPSFHLIDVEKYFTEEEVAAFREYFRVESQKTYPKLDKGYGAKIAYDEEKDELVHLYIYNTEERKIKEGDVETITDVFLDTVFRWENPDYEDSELHYYSFETTIKQFMQFPYAQYGEESWLEWKQDEHLNNYLEGTREGNISKAVNGRQRGKYENTYINRIYLGDNSEKDYGNPDYILITNFKLHPWKAAIDSLKKIYVYAACFAALCMAVVLYFTNRVEQKQIQLEQMRRDFTNAVAHELKTPIAIIRGIFENMEKEKSEEKNDRYRHQGVRQTEVMDDLIKEMIFISKMDQEDLKLKQEDVSVLSIIEEQMDKLETLTQEKNLRVEYQKEEDWVIQGDKTYLEKAFFSILENAVAYNKPDGKIAIQISKDSCAIENTADPIPEENLPHLCDLFFTSNKSRKSDVGHKGLGLYLAKRIFDMHKMGMKIENSEAGVKVTVF